MGKKTRKRRIIAKPKIIECWIRSTYVRSLDMPAAWNERASPPPGFKEGEKKRDIKRLAAG